MTIETEPCPGCGGCGQAWESRDGEQTRHYRHESVLRYCSRCQGENAPEPAKKHTRLQEAAVCALVSMLHEFEEVRNRKWAVTDEYFQNVAELYNSLAADGVDLTGLEDEIEAINKWIDGEQ